MTRTVSEIAGDVGAKWLAAVERERVRAEKAERELAELREDLFAMAHVWCEAPPPKNNRGAVEALQRKACATELLRRVKGASDV